MSRGQHRKSRGKHLARTGGPASAGARRVGRERTGRARRVVAGVFALAVALFSASAVYAGLTAKATGTEQVSSGTLDLTLSADTNSIGFSNFAAKMAPGDVDNVAVNLNNTGTH